MDLITTAVDVVVNGGITAGIMLGFTKFKWFQAAEQVVRSEEGNIVKGLEAIVHTPAAKALEAKLHLELNSAASDVKKFALSTYAQAAIQGAQKAYDALSPSEQAAAIAFVKSHVPRSAEATEKEIVAALKDAPALAKMFEGDATFAKAKELTDLLSKASAPDLSNTTQGAPVSDGQATATAS